MTHNTNKIIKPNKDIIDRTFPTIDEIKKKDLIMTTEGLYSVSGKNAAKFLAKIIYKNMHSLNVKITDATGNNGSDTIMLAKYYKHINSIELDKTNFKALKNNVEVFGYNDKITLINGDSTNILAETIQDVIYIDAPWGGKNYKKEKQLKLYMGQMELSDIYLKYKNRAKLFVFKVPLNYDINNLILKTKVQLIKVYNFQNNNRTIFLIICIKN